jgi:hypothetical protein
VKNLAYCDRLATALDIFTTYEACAAVMRVKL